MAFALIAGQGRAYSESQTASSQAAPTVQADGVPLNDLKGLEVMVEANSTKTLSGAGTLQCYLWDGAVGAWVRRPDMDLTVSPGGTRRLAFPTISVDMPRGSVYYAATSVTVSGGTTVVVYIIGAAEHGSRNY